MMPDVKSRRALPVARMPTGSVFRQCSCRGEGALREQQDKLWIVPYRTRFPTGDGAVEQSVREHLHTWLAEVPVDAGPQREDLLLSLLRCTRILDSVWSESELETLRPQIDKRTEMSPIGKEVKRSADQTRAAVAASIAAGT